MTPPSPTRRFQRAATLSVLTLAVALGACGGGGAGKSGGQVAAKVNDSEITAHQVELLAQRDRVMRPASQAEAVNRGVLDALIEQELAAQAARKDGLDGTPRTVQLMELAKREVLARAWQDKVTEQARGPSSDEIDRYYDAHPALFAQRKLYTLTETLVELEDTAKATALKTRIEATENAAKLADLLAAEGGVRHSSRNLRTAAEELPLAMLDKVASLRDGQSIAVPRDGGLRLLTVVSAQPAKLERTAAKPMIEAFLLNERKVAMLREAMGQLRKSASVTYTGPYAAAASAPAAAPRATP